MSGRKILAAALILLPSTVAADCPAPTDLEAESRACVDAATEACTATDPESRRACVSDVAKARAGLATCLAAVERNYLARARAGVATYKWRRGIR